MKILEKEHRTKEFEFALETVRCAGRLAGKIRREMISQPLHKDDRSPVTVADFAVQAVTAARLRESFPEDPLVAEEDAAQLRNAQSKALLGRISHFVRHLSPKATTGEILEWIDFGKGEPAQRFWTLDPIDGTKGFLRGDQYVVALALIEDGIVQLGFLGCPELGLVIESGKVRLDTSGQAKDKGVLVFGARGEGTFVASMEGKEIYPLQVSAVSASDHARLLRSFESGHTNPAMMNRVVEIMGTREKPVLMDSQAKYAVLAAGQGDLLLRLLSRPDYREHIWDQAAGSLIVEEAGGRVTDVDGKKLDFSTGRKLTRNRGVVASNGHLHQQALQAVRQAASDTD